MLQSSEHRDWPATGPRTLAWVLSENYLAPDARHSRFITGANLTYTDPGADEHQACCRLIYTAVMYDELQVTELASFEMAAHRIQMIKLKYRDRIISAAGSSAGGGSLVDRFHDTHLHMGWSATRGLCVAPELDRYISERLAEENQASKQPQGGGARRSDRQSG